MSFSSRLEIIARLGAGSFGEVHKVRHLDSGQEMALKTTTIRTQTDVVNADRETTIMSECTSPNVVPLICHWQEDSMRHGNMITRQYILMELCTCSLKDLITNHRGVNQEMDIDFIKFLARNITKGLAYIHSRRFIHRDLKPDNILLSAHGVPKIGDFGLSTLHSIGDTHSAGVGTRVYQSPEILLGADNYTEAVDLWALGCIIAELFLLKSLFHRDTEIGMLCDICELIGLSPG